MEWTPVPRQTLGPAVVAMLLLSTIFVLFGLPYSANPFAAIHPDSSALNRGTGSPNSSHFADIHSIATNALPPSPSHSEEDDSNIISIPPDATPPPSPVDQAPSSKQQHEIIARINPKDDQKIALTPPNVPPDSVNVHVPTGNARKEVRGACDLFTGRWERDARGSIYTNGSCKTLPDMRNCGKYGKEKGYVYWRWRPDGCELPMFDPEAFLGMARGKQLMFVGDSLARNQMESLLCLLSQAEAPLDTFKDLKNKHRTWYFPSYNFTLMVVWTEFLVNSAEIIVNGTPSDTFNINLDKMNPMWAKKLPQLNFAVINSGNWFTRRTYVHRKGKLIGCVHCWDDKTIPSISVPAGIRMVFSAALKYITKCRKCQHDLLTVVRTYSMSHFEHGSWHNGGYCNRTKPLLESDLSTSHEAWEFRKIQIEEMGRVKKKTKKRFELMDVTKAMMVRADAHPGRHWVAKKTSDCLHWCLPGPIDMWNELLLEIIKKNT